MFFHKTSPVKGNQDINAVRFSATVLKFAFFSLENPSGKLLTHLGF